MEGGRNVQEAVCALLTFGLYTLRVMQPSPRAKQVQVLLNHTALSLSNSQDNLDTPNPCGVACFACHYYPFFIVFGIVGKGQNPCQFFITVFDPTRKVHSLTFYPNDCFPRKKSKVCHKQLEFRPIHNGLDKIEPLSLVSTIKLNN